MLGVIGHKVAAEIDRLTSFLPQFKVKIPRKASPGPAWGSVSPGSVTSSLDMGSQEAAVAPEGRQIAGGRGSQGKGERWRAPCPQGQSVTPGTARPAGRMLVSLGTHDLSAGDPGTGRACVRGT